MNQKNFGKFIKEIRKKHNLTQKDLADKYHVTYQAVSKWENGKNMPDTALIRKISQDFGVSLEAMFDGEVKKKVNSKIIFSIIFFVVVFILLVFILSDEEDFSFKTLSSNCSNFNISGNIAYNDKKTSIYITNIEYCGGDDVLNYEKIECVLYEVDGDLEKKISTYSYDDADNITLEDFLKTVTIVVHNYEKSCKEYSENSLYLSLNATDSNDKVTTYKIPLAFEESCSH